MASSVVIKVKYENKLRRFNATVNGNQQLELDIEGLRAKIRSLFNFTAESELELSYEDEDEDIVALVDEDDLQDVLKQGLNPVRITVKMNTGSAASVRSSGTSTPLPAQDHIYAGVADLLNVRGHLSKLSSEVASRTAGSTPVPILAEFIEGIAKAADSFLNAQKKEPVQAASASGKEKEGSHSHIEEAKRKLGCSSDSVGMRAIPAALEAERKHLGIATSSGKGIAVSELEKKVINKEELTGRTKEAKRSNIECPFSGLPMQPFPKVASFGTQGSVFHRGVQCDVCGVHPITGPRFKSKVKLDYDLCQLCFLQNGTCKESDYTRIDFPAQYRNPWPLKGNPHMHRQKPWAHCPPPRTFFSHHIKELKPKIDSRFVLDVNVMDGTIMAPKTPFSKIWRMRNNGNLPWIHGTQLVWIGGDKFSPTSSVEIEIPISGLYPEQEVDVEVDFVAPELPGRYISYWKMASSSGQKFGQRVWVLIQVDASLPSVDLPDSLNLNLPPEGTAENISYTTDSLVEPLDAAVDNMKDHFIKKQMLPLMTLEQADNLRLLPTNNFNYAADDPTVDRSSSAPPLHGPLQSIQMGPSQPKPSSSEPLSPFSAAYPRIDAVPVEEVADDNTKSEVEDVLLMELEQMGFKQVEMNKKVLKKNEYDFEKSLDELCSVSEWDLLLEEMQAMGFVDGEANKKVLAKNNGSLKHAVMDLITRENV